MVVCSSKERAPIVKYLIGKGINIDARGGTLDASTLNLAAGAGHLEIVKYLIEVGAEIDVSSAKRNSSSFFDAKKLKVSIKR